MVGIFGYRRMYPTLKKRVISALKGAMGYVSNESYR
jgi:hypothetical protein